MTVGIIVGSIRTERIGASIAQWVTEQAAAQSVDYTLIDLADFDLPLVTGVPQIMLNREYDHPEVTRFSEAIAACDSFVVVSPEYNRSIPGALKNAIDSLGTEWSAKPVAFVTYSYDGGIRVADHLRLVFGNFAMPSLRNQININLSHDWQDNALVASESRNQKLDEIFSELTELAAQH